MKKTIETTIKVRFDECDYYMHVNNSVYQNYMDVGIGDYMRQICPDLRNLTFMIHKVHASIDYLEAAEFEDELLIKTTLASTGNTSITFEHEIYKEGTLIVKATIIFVMLDVASGEKCSVPEVFLTLEGE